MPEKTIPATEDLTEAIRQLKLERPTLGIKKVTNRLSEIRPGWKVSENRVKKALQEIKLAQIDDGQEQEQESTATQTNDDRESDQENMTIQASNDQEPTQNEDQVNVEEPEIVKSGIEDDPSVPVSFIDPKLDFASKNVRAKMLDQVTGKGLFAANDIRKNTIIFDEEPLIYFPPWLGFNNARNGTACGLCARPFRTASLFQPRCNDCSIAYCTKSCKAEAWEKFHRLECTGLNPAVRDYMNLCRAENWQAAMAVARIYAHLISAHQKGELEQVQYQYDSFATVNQSERQAKETEWIFMEHPTRELWTKARKLLAKAYNPPPKKCNIKKPLPEAVAAKLFDDEDTFLDYLGKFNINNQNGGMYRIHSHINHNCHPNVSIDYLKPGTQFKLSVRAIRDIKEGEQLCETYVNPRWDKETRQTYLTKSYMFDCKCERCETDSPLTDELRSGLRLREE